ncbi:MAG: hypothetical protein WC209_00245 [Ignavibacteriaceae bacterium]|jgi:hypothetical protein
MKNKQIVFIYFVFYALLLSSTGRGQSDNYDVHYGSFGYNNHLGVQQAVNLATEGENYSSRYLLEIKMIPITWTTNDKFNDHRTNFAFPLSPVVFVLQGIIFRRYLETISPILWKFPQIILGSNHHLFFNDLYEKGNYLSPYGFSVFYKNDLDFFTFQSHHWMSFSPGIGISYFHNFKNGIPPLRLQLGYCKNYSWNSSSIIKTPTIFFEISVIGRND